MKRGLQEEAYLKFKLFYVEVNDICSLKFTTLHYIIMQYQPILKFCSSIFTTLNIDHH